MSDDQQKETTHTTRELVDVEKKFIEEYLRGQPTAGEVHLQEWVLKVKKKGKNVERIVVITDYHVIVIKHGRTGISIQRCSHLYHLVTCGVDDAGVMLDFGEWAIRLETMIGLVEDIVTVLWRLVGNITRGFAPQVICQFHGTLKGDPVDNDRLAMLAPVASADACHTFLATFRAYCAYYGIKPAVVVSPVINQLFKEESHVLDMSVFGMDPAEVAATFMVFMSALEYDSYFTAIEASHCTIGDDPLAVLGMMLASNTSIHTLRLRDIGLTKVSGAVLGDALMKNTNITHFDISGNSLGDGVADLCVGLRVHALHTLRLRGANAREKSTTMLLEHLASKSASVLVDLDMSDCRFDMRATKLLANMFAAHQSKLARLSVANTAVDIASLLNALIDSRIKLQHLDVSRNDIAEPHLGLLLSRVLSTHTSLASVDVSNTRIPPAVLEVVLASFLMNNNRPLGVLLSIRCNGVPLGREYAVKVASLLAACDNVEALEMNDIQCSTVGGAWILRALQQHPHLQRLCFARNCIKSDWYKKGGGGGGGGDGLRFGAELARLIETSNLTHLSIIGNASAGYSADLLLALAAFKGAECRLHALDISGNHFGAVSLTEALKTPALSRMRLLSIDDNELCVGDLVSVAHCLKSHHFIRHITVTSLGASKGALSAQQKKQLEVAQRDIEGILRRNFLRHEA